jgi:hypothetical protein
MSRAKRPTPQAAAPGQAAAVSRYTAPRDAPTIKPGHCPACGLAGLRIDPDVPELGNRPLTYCPSRACNWDNWDAQAALDAGMRSPEHDGD